MYITRETIRAFDDSLHKTENFLEMTKFRYLKVFLTNSFEKINVSIYLGGVFLLKNVIGHSRMAHLTDINFSEITFYCDRAL